MRERQIARQRMSSQLYTVREALLKEAVTLVIDEESEDRSCQPPPLKVKKTLGSLIHQDAKVIADPASLTSTVSTWSIEKGDVQFPIIDGDDDPLEWWRIRGRDFPLLSQFARRYLAIQASSAPSERLFSKAGQIVTPQRAQLKPDKANVLVFLAENL